MEIAKVTSKGQITLPKSVRDKLKLSIGDKVVFVEKSGNFVIANSSNIVLKESNHIANIEGIVASMDFEDISVSSESLKYAEQRTKNQIGYDNQMKHLKQKYAVNKKETNE